MRALLVAALLVAAPVLAGCIGAKDEPAPAPVKKSSANNSSVENATLPDGRGLSSGNLETNKTENGTGGIQHKHDYWHGKDNVVLLSEDAFFQATPVYPDGQGSQPGSIAYIKFPLVNASIEGPKLVYEGTVEVQVTTKALQLPVGAPDPQPPSLTLRYRTAADTKFRDAGTLAPDATVKIPVTAKETDMPHSLNSLWAFELVADKPTQDSVNITIAVKRGSDVVNWPGHPDFYADKTSRIVMDKEAKVHRNGIEEGLLYGSASSWSAPDKLISYGTGTLDVFVNISSATASNGAPPTGFFLEYHNATLLDQEDTFNERIHDAEGKNDLKSYHFKVKVDPNGMDGPYQPGSLWGFRIVATFGNVAVPGVGGVGLCPGCFPYDVAYHMTIVAHKGDAAAMTMAG